MSFKISPGKITALWIILRTAHNNKRISKTDLSQIASSTSLRGGGLPIDEVIEIAINLGFLIVENEIMFLHESCEEIVLSFEGEEPSKEIIRELLKKIIIKSKPSWTSFISKPIEERIYAISSDWIEVLDSVNLIDLPLEDDARKWWRSLHKNFEQIEEDFLAKIGNIGESHSIHFEKTRLISCKKHDLADRIKWVSKISDDYGFDISSFYGDLNIFELEKDTDICIEVKSSILESKNSFYFILTRNEWNKALNTEDMYFFHLWRNVKTADSSAEGPLIIPAKKIEKLIPKDQCENCNWLKCRIEINFNKLNKDIYDPNEILLY